MFATRTAGFETVPLSCACCRVLRFVEYGEYKGHLYGTSTDAIDEVLKRGRMCILDVEPHVSSTKKAVTNNYDSLISLTR